MESKDLKYILGAVIIIIGAGAIVAYMNRPDRPTETAPTLTSEVEHKPAKAATTTLITRENQTEHDVIYNSKGFFPREVTVNKGDIVKWINQTGGDMWVASGPHPAHTGYPGTDDSKCSSAPAGSMFDACKSVKMGDSYTFIFDNVGTWKYHNHMNPKDFATIIVK